eukprot:CAMPEP_0204821352 /NCGR_PEP_ID=MMETSP1018-20131115/9533_1 /ASSEMBLY_ACC=CAM_ASM_000518 /TAXON_ID=46462 /ORGANISM="Anophryoides haemophila, Strain AH6" /LENGTH=160 /DNA_ID=CAMNT_0051927509 /DNA_START=27 /DNA_END=509 /DNA_ORIENTATION=-
MKSLLRSKIFANQFSTIKGKQTIGFIGLGNMGSGMIRNLNSEHFEVVAYDVVPETRERIRAEGHNVVDDVQEIITNPNIDHIITMVPKAAHVKELCDGENGIFKNAKKGLKVIDCSTIGPIPATELYESAKAQGYEFVDAPVSGGIGGAANGTLTFMVGA